MPSPSYYFTLFKKFQVVNHAPAGTFHGSGAPSGGFDLKNPAGVFGTSNTGSLLGATTNPADSPLWAVLNSRASGNPGYSPVNVGGIDWPTMPPGLPLAWTSFQVSAPAPKLVQVFGEPPFPDHVVLAIPGEQRSLKVAALGQEYLGLSIGIQFSRKRLRPGPFGELEVVQRTAVPKIDHKKQRYKIEQVTVGGFTLRFEAHDSREVPKRGGTRTRKYVRHHAG